LFNCLSFGPDSPLVDFGDLNVIIGPNASGKSNLESLDLKAAAAPVSHWAQRLVDRLAALNAAEAGAGGRS
jgi:recombinational DNA repair ATPase RecF